MNTLQQLSFLYPNAIAVGVILIALLVIYLAGRALVWIFSSTEKKVEPEPSIMTELDELRRSNERLSTMYDQLAYDYDVLDNEYKKLQDDFNKHKATGSEVLYALSTSQSQSYDRMMRIAELEKELSDLRSSCDDSFLNTVERANQLSLKCASLENTIAEFDVYKKDAQEVHDKLTKLYESEQIIRNNLSSKLWHSRREVSSLKRDLISATTQIAELGDKYTSCDRERSEYESMYNSILAQYAELKVKMKAIEQANQNPEHKPEINLSWVKWVATNEMGDTWAYSEKPIKLSYSWKAADEGVLITPVMAIVLCDRVPSWSDEEPTPVIKK